MSAPTISAISPPTGSVAGGTVVTITGTNLASPTSVTFGANAGSITASTDTTITVTSPAGTGAVTVTVTTAGGTATTTFTYTAVTGYYRPRISHTQGYGWQTNVSGTPSASGSVQFDARRSRSQLAVIVQNVPDTEATFAALTSGLPNAYLPAYDPDDPGLQVYQITYRCWHRHPETGTADLELIGHYGPIKWETVSIGTGHINQRVYTDTTGGALPVKPNGQPGTRTIRRTFSIIRFRCAMYTAVTPADYNASVNFINNGTYVISDGGQTIVSAAQDTLLFAAARKVKVRAGNTAIWMPEFEFHWMTSGLQDALGKVGWWEQTYSTGSPPIVGNTLMYPEATLPAVP